MTSEHRRFSAHPEGSSTDKPNHQPYYGKSWAIVIGINDYDEHAPLVNARHDAEAVAELLQDVYQFEEVHTLYDAEATERAIMSWLRDDLRKRTKADDRVIFFFAGHGTTLKVNDRVIGGYLIPHGAQPDSYADYIDMQELNRACGAIPAKHILLILDCCFSGVAAVTARSAPPPSPSAIDDVFVRRVTQRRAWQVLTAGASDELVADSGLRPGNSAFTAALLDGLKGEADHNNDGLLTASELANYVRPRVVRETASGGQSPFFNYLAGSEEGDFVFLVPGRALKIPEASVPRQVQETVKRSPWIGIVGVLVITVVVALLWQLLNERARIESYVNALTDVAATQTAGHRALEVENATATDAALGAAGPTKTAAVISLATRQAESTQVAREAQITLTAAQPAVGSTPTPTEPSAGAIREFGGIPFVYLSAGEFIMGSANDDSAANDDEKPQHIVYVDGFWIGRTEVTNAQYRAFVDAGGYDEQHFWTEDGWAWRSRNDITAPRLWEDERYNGPDQPVIGVSWYEAIAYANWLADETGQAVRLPTEAEWEKACRGTDGLIYPWGDGPPTAELANFDGNVGGTTPVGDYPKGASPYGVLGMAGNVWEWTSSLYRDSSYRADDGREDVDASGYRVLRGGAFQNESNTVRCAVRNSYLHWSVSYGVRVACCETK